MKGVRTSPTDRMRLYETLGLRYELKCVGIYGVWQIFAECDYNQYEKN